MRKCYGIIKAYFQAKEKEEKRASDINPAATPLDVPLEELIERGIECAKNFGV